MSDDEPQDDGPRTIMPGSGPDRDDMAASYLPDDEDWVAKTVLDLNDPHAIATLLQFHRMFPEVDDLDPLIQEFTEDFLRGRTSVGGQSRDEYLKIITSMFGGGVDDDVKKMHALGEALAGEKDE